MILTGQLAQKLFNRQQIKLYFGYDHLGIIKRVYHEGQHLVKSIEYDSFGNILEETLPELFIPLGFAGGVLDKDTRFIKYMYRDYYPYIGRFTCIDPAKDYGTDGDYYDYCSDDPVGRFDPLGLFSLSTYTPFSRTYDSPLEKEVNTGLKNAYTKHKIKENRPFAMGSFIGFNPGWMKYGWDNLEDEVQDGIIGGALDIGTNLALYALRVPPLLGGFIKEELNNQRESFNIPLGFEKYTDDFINDTLNTGIRRYKQTGDKFGSITSTVQDSYNILKGDFVGTILLGKNRNSPFKITQNISFSKNKKPSSSFVSSDTISIPNNLSIPKLKK